jgi:GNAT superfamily N-acetyltransferase
MLRPLADYELSTDPSRLDVPLIHEFLCHHAYWALGRDRQVVERSIAGSLCFGAYGRDGRQVGFARAVTDRATFAWLADVFVLADHRGRGISKSLVHAALEHPDLQGLKRWVLGTRDAHELYARFGFVPLVEPQRWMERSGGGL